MAPQLAVARPLQQGQEERPVGLQQAVRPRGHGALGDLVLRIPEDRAQDLVEDGQGEGVASPGIGRGEENLVHVVPDRPVDQPGGRPPHVQVPVGQLGQRLAVGAIEARVPRAGRIGVHALGLKGDPLGPEIAFLENMNPEAAAFRGRDRGHVHFDAVVEDHEIGDFMVGVEAVDPVGPCLFGGAVGGVRAEISPVRKIAAVENDLAYFEAARAQGLGDFREERTERTAQEQEVALARSRTTQSVTDNCRLPPG